MALRARPTGLRPAFGPTERQIAYLRDLISKKTDMDPDVVSLWSDSGLLTSQSISEMISEYKAMPDLREPEHPEPGYYKLQDGNGNMQYFCVVPTKDGKRTYAKHLTKAGPGASWRWEYERGSGALLAHMTPLTPEEAAEWGRMHGRCIHCFRELTVPESVKRGYGPKCAEKIEKRNKEEKA